MNWADAWYFKTRVLEEAAEQELLADVSPEQWARSEQWLPPFRHATSVLDGIWVIDESAPGAVLEAELLVGQLKEAAHTAQATLPVLCAALLRRLVSHLQAVTSASSTCKLVPEYKAARAFRIVEAVLLIAPPPSESAAAAAAASFDETVKIMMLLGRRLDAQDLTFGGPLADMLRVATSTAGAGPLQCPNLLDWMLAERVAGRRLQGAFGKAMLDVTLRLLHCGHRCGLGTAEAVAHAMRAAAWLASGLDTDCDDEVRHAMAVANDRHSGALLELSVDIWMEAMRTRDEVAFMRGISIRDAGIPGGATQRRSARQAKGDSARRGEHTVLSPNRVGRLGERDLCPVGTVA